MNHLIKIAAITTLSLISLDGIGQGRGKELKEKVKKEKLNKEQSFENEINEIEEQVSTNIDTTLNNLKPKKDKSNWKELTPEERKERIQAHKEEHKSWKELSKEEKEIQLEQKKEQLKKDAENDVKEELEVVKEKIKNNQGKGNAFGKDKGNLEGKEFGQARAEEAKAKHEKLEAESTTVIAETEEKVNLAKNQIEAAKEKLQQARQENTLSEEEADNKEIVIMKAEEKLEALQKAIEKQKILLEKE